MAIGVCGLFGVIVLQAVEEGSHYAYDTVQILHHFKGEETAQAMQLNLIHVTNLGVQVFD